MDKSLYEKFVALIYETAGISLNDKKEALVSARIAKRMRVHKIDDQKEYYKFLLGDTSGEEMVHMIDAISTNVTQFFREGHHFDFLAERVGEWLAKGDRKFRFWSAGCSSGEEPYSIAMTLKEKMNGHHTDIKILATDISTKILNTSVNGRYDQKKMDAVPGMLKSKYFDKSGRGDDVVYTANSDLKKLIVFKRLNLSIVPFPMSGPMDVIFCRNVMIYFDNIVRCKLLEEFSRLLKQGGYLMVGHAESLTGMLSGFKAVMPTVYVKK